MVDVFVERRRGRLGHQKLEFQELENIWWKEFHPASPSYLPSHVVDVLQNDSYIYKMAPRWPESWNSARFLLGRIDVNFWLKYSEMQDWKRLSNALMENHVYLLAASCPGKTLLFGWLTRCSRRGFRRSSWAWSISWRDIWLSRGESRRRLPWSLFEW